MANWERARKNEPLLGDHVLRILFSDGTVGDVDLAGEHWTGVLEPHNDPPYFAQVEVAADAGTVAWPDGHRSGPGTAL